MFYPCVNHTYMYLNRRKKNGDDYDLAITIPSTHKVNVDSEQHKRLVWSDVTKSHKNQKLNLCVILLGCLGNH